LAASQVRIGVWPSSTRSDRQVEKNKYRATSLPSRMSFELTHDVPPHVPPIGMEKTPFASIVPWPEWYSAVQASNP